jgi:ADP-heptose:LPS heptosyltransferase
MENENTVIKKPTALMLRAGGVGDIIILTAVAKVLHDKGYDVDFFCGSPTGEVHKLIENLYFFKSVKQVNRLNGIDCIRDGENFISVELFKQNYDEVYDFKFSVENNVAGLNPKIGWRNSINSNYMNWVDLSLAWCNIDYTKISDNDKRPQIKLDASIEYTEWLKTLPFNTNGAERDYKIIGIQLQASSLVRSWYRAQELPDIVHVRYPNDVVLIYTGAEWVVISKSGKERIVFPESLNPLMCSAWLVGMMDVFISADSGMSHIAEATGTKCITIYTTVPAWTREKYYKYSYPINATCECHPCFGLDVFCPLERKRAEESLTPVEKDIIACQKAGTNITEVAKKYQTVPRAVDEQYEAATKKLQALSAKMPKCVEGITPEIIMDKLTEILNN